MNIASDIYHPKKITLEKREKRENFLLLSRCDQVLRNKQEKGERTPVSPVSPVVFPSIQLVAATSKGRKASNDRIPSLTRPEAAPDINRTLTRHHRCGDGLIHGECLRF
jgi:hypothetical protein